MTQGDSSRVQLYSQLHPEWQEALAAYKNTFDRIEKQLDFDTTTPQSHHILRVLSGAICKTRVVIFGQDPYPTAGHAHGLAFSVDQSVAHLPPSLRNIFKELQNDCAVERTMGDLSDWAEQGVMLINRILTTRVGESMAHKDLGWQEITTEVARVLGQRDVVAILWGKFAGEVGDYFRPEYRLSSTHPSPLSAHRGFFGSRPFSQCNAILVKGGLQEISW